MVKGIIFALVFLWCGLIVQGKADDFLRGKFLPVTEVSENSSDLPSSWESMFEDSFLFFPSLRIQQQHYKMDPTYIKPFKTKVKK